jgi:hypothetical protein
MKLIVSRKNNLNNPAPSESEVLALINSGFGCTVKAIPDAEVEAYIQTQALRGNVCFEFNFAGVYQSQTTVIKSQAA